MHLRNPLGRSLLALAATAAVCSSCVASGTGESVRSTADRATDAVADRVPPPPATHVAQGVRQGIAGCPIFPRNNVFHADITTLPASVDSERIVGAAGADLGVREPTSHVWQGFRSGMPINVVDSREVPSVDVLPGLYGYLSDLEDHPIPAAPRIEGDPGIAWDRHMLIVDRATCTSSEFFYVAPPNFLTSRWTAATAVKLDLTSNTIRSRGAATAAGVSLLAGMVRYEEVVQGEVDHMVHATLPEISDDAPLWPASATDGRSGDPYAPPMGTVFRLREDVNVEQMGPHARVIAEAMRTHGLLVYDTGPDLVGLSTENHSGWDPDALAGLSDLTLSDFEVVDISPLMVDPDSYEIR